MPLWIIGLGLGDEKDVSVKGAEAIAGADEVWLESYTSILGVGAEALEARYGKRVRIAYRETVESEAESILAPAKTSKVAFLVVGDPFGATTHTDLMIRAQDEGVEVTVIHNASIMNAAGACGLQLYNFGATISIPYFTETWRPGSFYDKLAYNARGGMHTLALLDIKVREPNLEALMRGRTKYDPPRFMTIPEAIGQLLEVEAGRGGGFCGPDSLGIGMARVGQATQRIVSGTLAELAGVDFGGPLHSLVICGDMHELERTLFDRFRVKPAAGAAAAAGGAGGGAAEAAAAPAPTAPAPATEAAASAPAPA